MPTVSLFACGRSTATNSTPAFCRPSRKCASRRKPVELGDHQLRAIGAAGLKGTGKLGAVVIALATLDLDMLSDQLPAAAVEKGLDRRALRFQPEAGFALALGADAQVGNEFAVMPDHGCLFFEIM